MELWKLSALELGAALQDGEVTAEDAVRAALNRITAHNHMNNAFLTVCAEEALRTAREGSFTGVLAGVPMAVKDNLCTKGLRTTCASKMLADYEPPYDATAVRWLQERGAILLGKLNMDEFGMGSTSETSFFGPVRNPWDLNRSPGGSSGGAAAAVAAGECWYALASDTGGSIRLPAAHCGVTGMKPTYGTVSRYGLVAYASSLDQIGPIARSAADCAAVLDAIMGRDPRDATSVEPPRGGMLDHLDGDVRGLRVGVPGSAFAEGVAPEVARAVLGVAEVLKSRGAVVEWLDLPPFEEAVPAYYIIASAEASSNLARFDGVQYGAREEGDGTLAGLYRASRAEAFGQEVKRRILMGAFVLSDEQQDAYYKKAGEVKARLAEDYGWAFQRFDLLLTPVAGATAPLLGDLAEDPLPMYRADRYTVPANLAGLPALSLPCGLDELGLPIGAQLMGPSGMDRRVLNAAHGFQLDTSWHRQSPEGGVSP